MKRNHPILLLVTVAILVIAFSAFTGNDPGEKFKGYTKRDDGTYFLLHKKGAGLYSPDTGGAIFCKMKFKTEADSVFMDLNAITKAPSYPLRVDAAKFNGDFLEYMLRMHVGDSISFFVSLDSLHKYYPEDFKFDPQFDTMKYLGFSFGVDSIYPREKVVRLRKQAQAEQKKQEEEIQKMKEEEPALIKKYISDNKIKAKPTASGLYYIKTKDGKGDKIKNGQTVKCRYVGKFLDGTIFDSNQVPDAELLSFVVGAGTVIPGFEEGAQLMKKGEQATLIIPSSQAYGDGMGRMKPYATLVFDIEIIDVIDTPQQ